MLTYFICLNLNSFRLELRLTLILMKLFISRKIDDIDNIILGRNRSKANVVQLIK